MDISLEAQFIIIAKILGAMLLGGAIGFEREIVNRPAGLRTHMLVAGASALLPLVGLMMLRYFIMDTEIAQNVESDPFRVLGAMVTGIAFLGAGTIIRKQDASDVKGLTTAGSLLMAGGVGLCAAINLWLVAGCITAATILVLIAMRRFEGWLGIKNRPKPGATSE